MNELPSFQIVLQRSLASAKEAFPDSVDLTWKYFLLPAVPFFAIGIFGTELPLGWLILSLILALIFGICFALPATGGLMELALATVEQRERRFQLGYGWQILWVEILKALLFVGILLPLTILKWLVAGTVVALAARSVKDLASSILAYRYCLTTAILIAEDSSYRAVNESWRIGRGCGFRLTWYVFVSELPLILVAGGIVLLTGGWDSLTDLAKLRHAHDLLPELPRLMVILATGMLPAMLFTCLFQPFFYATIYRFLRGVPQQVEKEFITILPEAN